MSARRASIVAALVALAAAAGCTTPDYGDGHLQCAPDRSCPSGFYCAGDDHCWRAGSGPGGGGADLGVPDDLAGVTSDLGGAAPDLAIVASKCVGSPALFCEGFEKPLASSGNNWSQMFTNGTLAIDNTHVFRGTGALHAHIAGGAAMTGPFALIGTSKPFPIVGALYARVWGWFSPALPNDFEQFLNFTDGANGGASVATDTGFVTLDDYTGTKLYQPSSTKLPLGRWTCITFVMSQGSTTGAVQIGVDGSALLDIPASGPTPTAVQVLLGLDFNGNSSAIGAYDAWFDELLIDNKPRSCTD